ncbi:RHS repeat-associated core domain-containing protein [Nocardiopsis sp. LOL_012]|uniref:RHS repeat-associated core domain-containing protein n=1 Tax=Nocardiopsis sp. LOL_012 TaxID=3345409 RepID=UPI003A85190B
MESAGVNGVLIRLTRTDDESGVALVDLAVDYSAFADAFGGGFGERLELVEVDECLLDDSVECRDRAPQTFTTENNTDTQTVSGTVPALEGNGVLLAAAAAGDSSQGDYSATDLSASSSWNIGLQTGGFTWSYPIDTPPVAGDLTPGVELGYSSSAVDGRVSSSNNQTSWIGEGFDYTPGFIERKYKPCADDQPDSGKTGDLCWSHHNATFSLNGRAGEMFLDEDGTWRMRHDDASQIERLTGTTNGDNDGEYWRITTTDGTQYYFGMNRLPGYSSGDAETNSAWTVPVYGRTSGQPCHGSSFADSWCQQAWRWNLDYVVDVHGNVMTYTYTAEGNHYGRNMKAADETPYDRGGYLRHIDYGLTSDDVYGTAPARVSFAVSERCIPTDDFDCAVGEFNSDNADHWPDAPFDRHCASGQECTNRLSPTFWTRKKMDSITTQVHDGSAYQTVDSWELEHSYPQNGDGTASDLWLQSITHTGHVEGTETEPALRFGGTQMENRADTTSDGFAPMLKWRITSITSETGARTDISYDGGGCDPDAFPEPHLNDTRCFPVVRDTADGEDVYTDWFNKYVVTQVSEFDLVTDQPENLTTYEYVGDPAWRYQDANGFTRDKHRTWSDWRGYEQVRVIDGLSGQTQSQTEHHFFRGMHGDHLPEGTRTVTVTDSEGGEHTDLNEYNGFTLEQSTRNGPGGDVVEKTISRPWSRVTGERDYSWGTVESRMTGMASNIQYTAVSGGWMRTGESAEYDSLGRVTQTLDHGDLDVSGDEQCTRVTYADNPSLHILDSIAREEKVAVDCDTTPTYPDDLISDRLAVFDGGELGDAPTAGLATRTLRIADHDGSDAVYQTTQETEYDRYGRTVSETDALDNETTISYSSDVPGGTATTVVTTNPLGHTKTEHLDPFRGLPVAEVDANDNRTDMAYDPLGRLTRVWTPDQVRAEGVDPAMRFEYFLSNEVPTVVATHIRRDDGEYATSYQIYDGLLRQRQEQKPAVGGGRLITDVFHDSRGLQVQSRHAYYNEQDPGSDLFVVNNEDDIPRYTETVYDGAERPVEVITMSRGVELWRTTSENLGDRQLVTPADGAIPTTTIKDVRGQTVELRQHEGATPAADYTALTYTHTPDGQLETVTDEAGNVWRNHYDLRGRKIRTDDPDRGTTTYVYDAADQLISTTDARGETIVYTYDDLGRKVAQREGGTDGPLLASWTYDTVAKGELSRATRYVGELEYTTSIHSYDAMGRSVATTINIPNAPEHSALSGSYRFRSTYNSDGSIRTNHLPAAGGLPEEVISYTYNDMGMATRMRGLSASETLYYVNDTVYSKQGLLLQRESYRADGNHQAKPTWYTRTYDPATNRLLNARVHHEIGLGTLVEQNYDYDAAGNVLSIRDTPTAQETQSDVQCFIYDEMRRLQSEWTSHVAGDQPCADGPSTDTVGGAAAYWNDYTYDELGNRTSETRHGLAAGDMVEYTFNRPEAGQDQPHAVTSVESSATSSGSDGDSEYTYDEAGNMVTRVTSGRTQELEWNAEGRLAAVHEADDSTDFVYDTEGERLLRDDGTVVTLYLPGMEIQYNKNQFVTAATRLYEHNGQVVASRSTGPAGSGVHWMFSDHHGSGQLALDSVTGEKIQRRFTAFGSERGRQGGAWPNSRGFVGGVVDEGIGLTQLGARSYDAQLGSFISADPVVNFADSQQMHAFAYANNNPVSFTDPDGLFLKRTFSQLRKWAAYRARQAAIRAYQAKLAAIRAWRIRQAAIRAAQIRAAQIRAARIRAARIRAAKIAAAKRRAAAERAAALRKAAAARAARERAERAADARRRAAVRRAESEAQHREAAQSAMYRSSDENVEYQSISLPSSGVDFPEPTDNPSGPMPIDCADPAYDCYNSRPHICSGISIIMITIAIGTLVASAAGGPPGLGAWGVFWGLVGASTSAACTIATW